MSRRLVAVLCTVLAAGTVLAAATMAAASAVADSGRTASLTWNAPRLTDPDRRLTSVSCVAHDDCRAGATPDRIERWDGQQWQPGSRFPTDTVGIYGIDCTSLAFCAAVQVMVFDGAYRYRPITRRPDGTWNQTSPLIALTVGQTPTPDVPYYGSVSCTDSSYCLLVNGQKQFQRWNGTSWSAPVSFADDAGRTYVSCASRHSCRSVSDTGSLYTWNGSSWLASRMLGDFAAVGIDCPTTAFCMTVDFDSGSYVAIDGSSITPVRHFDGYGRPLSVSCTDRNFCISVDNNGGSFRWDGTSWSGPHRNPVRPADYRVSCSSPGFCAAVSSEGYAIERVAGTWQPAQRIYPASGQVEDVSCAERQLCVLVDLHGNASAFNGTSWTLPRQVSPEGNALYDVSCAPGVSFCAAADDRGQLQFRRHGKWSAPQFPTAHHGTDFYVGCGSPTFCMIVTERQAVRVWNGSSWRTVGTTVYGEYAGYSLSCRPDGCVISGADSDHTLGDHAYVYRVGDPALTDAGDSHGVAAFSCLSVSDCVGQGDEDGILHTYRFDGSAWGVAPGALPADHASDAMSCVSSSYCLAAYGRSVSTWDGSSWSTPRPILGDDIPVDVDVRSLSCASSICAAVTYEGWTVLAT